MKKSMRLMMALLAIMAMFATACGSDAADDTATGGDTVATTDDTVATDGGAEAMGDPVTLSFAHGFPEGHPIYQEVLIDWGQAINDATNGTVTLEFFPGGALGPPPTEYERVSTGVNDMGWSVTAYTPGLFPSVQVVEMPFLFDTAREGTDVLLTLWEEFPVLQEEFAGTKTLGLMVHDTGALWSSDGEKTSLADVSGMELRSAGASVNRLIEALDGTPVNMPVTELFDAMDRGTVDGTVIAASALEDFQLYEIIDSGILCDCYVLSFFVSMNLEQWNELSPAQQAAIESVSGRDTWLAAGDIFDRQNKVALDGAAEAGIPLYTPEGAEADAWRAAADVAVQRWIDEMEAAGKPGQEMYDRVLELTGG